MPTITNPITKALRIEQAMEVVDHLLHNPRKSIAEACKAVGIDEKTFKFWISQASESLEVYLDSKRETERWILMRILLAMPAINDKLIGDALSEFTTPADRVTVAEYLNRQASIYMERSAPSDSEAIRDVLGGPEQIPGESRFAGARPELEVITGRDGEVTVRAKEQVVLDVTPEQQVLQALEEGDIGEE